LNILRRLPLSRLLLLCGAVVAIGVSGAALASALGSGPVPPAKALAQAVHDTFGAPAVAGVTAQVTLTDHLLEGANLAGAAGQGGELTSNPLIAGGSGRLWVSSDGKVRLELQSESGDTEVVYDGHSLTIYDAASNTVYRYTPQQGEGGSESEITVATRTSSAGHHAPSVAKIEEAIAHIQRHADLSGATPVDVGGQPAYTVRISPRESGSLIAGAELSFDAVHGFPLRVAVYSTTTPAPVIELAATEVGYGPVAASVFELSPPPGAKVENLAGAHAKHAGSGGAAGAPSTHAENANGRKLSGHGHGIAAIGELETKAGSSTASVEGLPKVDINGTSASELRTELGTVLTFVRADRRYVLAGAVGPAAVEALARGL